VDTGSHSNLVYADCVDLSAIENASKRKVRASGPTSVGTERTRSPN
jgi:hypothetical protein